MSTTEIFLIAMGIIFTIPYLFWRLFRTEYWAPLVVVQIVMGILLGPGVLGGAAWKHRGETSITAGLALGGHLRQRAARRLSLGCRALQRIR